MKFLLTLSILLMSVSAVAASNIYNINVKISTDGQPETASGLTIEEGKTGTIVSETNVEKSYFEVVATEGEFDGNKGILMKFVVGSILKDGSRKVISQPTILAKAGEEASIEIGNNKKEKMTLKVIASRQAI